MATFLPDIPFFCVFANPLGAKQSLVTGAEITRWHITPAQVSRRHFGMQIVSNVATYDSVSY
jgi:hypothetical protein